MSPHWVSAKAGTPQSPLSDVWCISKRRIS